MIFETPFRVPARSTILRMRLETEFLDVRSQTEFGSEICIPYLC
jgi:hypothetical protein